jgi:phage repressor protein C with HTH and peptisase S24 domain
MDIGMITMSERIESLINNFGGTQTAFAELLGVRQSAVANWVARGAIPSSAMANIISKCDGVSERWLLLGEGDMLVPYTKNYYKNLEVSAGRLEFTEHDQSTELICIPGVKAEAFFPVRGCSMKPTIQEGDIVGVVKMDGFENISPEKIYLIITADNERMIKHIIIGEEDDDYVTLTSDNKDYMPFQIKKDCILSVYKVIFHGRIPE